MAEIDFIYFDLGNVILDFDHSIGCRRIEGLTGVPANDVHAALFESGLDERFETGLIGGEQFHAEFCQLTNSQLSKEELMFVVSDVFSANWAIYPLITQLRASGFPIGILSNTCQAHWDYIRSRFVVVRDFFAPLILSFEVKSMKPDARIYERAVELSGCEARKCFFVDDKPENVDGAIKAGIDAVLFRSVPGLVNELRQRGVSVNL